MSFILNKARGRIILTVFIFLCFSGGNTMARILNMPPCIFHTGTIDRITTKLVVINDSLYRFSPSTIYVSKGGRRISQAWFNKGETVSYQLDSHSRIIIIKKDEK